MMLPKNVKYIAIFEQFCTCWSQLYQFQHNTSTKNLHEVKYFTDWGSAVLSCKELRPVYITAWGISLSALCTTKWAI